MRASLRTLFVVGVAAVLGAGYRVPVEVLAAAIEFTGSLDVRLTHVGRRRAGY